MNKVEAYRGGSRVTPVPTLASPVPSTPRKEEADVVSPVAASWPNHRFWSSGVMKSV